MLLIAVIFVFICLKKLIIGINNVEVLRYTYDYKQKWNIIRELFIKVVYILNEKKKKHMLQYH